MRRSDFRYPLPKHLIAQRPLDERSASRLLVLTDHGVDHRRFHEIVDLLRPDDLLVVNDTQVIKARLLATKDSGGHAEILIERISVSEGGANEALCQVRVSKPLKPGRALHVDEDSLRVLQREGEFYRLRFPCDVLDFLEKRGRVPLPPYIERSPNEVDEARYQTVYGSEPGAVAAPTAGLHFDETLLKTLTQKGIRIVNVTLHVGAGTFQPVRTDDLSEHKMHEEVYKVPAETAKAINSCRGRVVAVGTTVVRTLESATVAPGCDGPAMVKAGSGRTSLFITPGYAFRTIDALITNFHLPESTLLMLVSAFAGYDRVMQAYALAVEHEYRFFSYGDAMFCERHV